MNMKILCIGLLALFLLTAGCADREQNADNDSVDVPDTPDVPISTADDLSENPASNSSEQVGSISQEDLDKLKADLEGMEFDDVGGLSE